MFRHERADVRVDCVCLIELIWSYWHEEGMLAQSVNAISRRFQNSARRAPRDPLAHFETGPAAAPQQYAVGLRPG